MRSDSERRARQLVAQLELISHVPAVSLDPRGGGGDEDGESRGGRRPLGGVERRDDREPEFALRSHEYFRLRLRLCRSAEDFDRVAAAAEGALKAWRHPKAPPVDSRPWEEQVARARGSIREVAAEWNLSPSRVHQLRTRYRTR